MELPKNITQIGESDSRCKIYVEDYVVSYLKQMNRLAQDKDMAVALYGDVREEGGVTYHFTYGACKLTFLQRETRHLSQAQQQEIEKFRRQYFEKYTFLGYRILNGEMIEGFHICEQGICRYISGYAQFYEKNDCMLAYMLDVREEASAEVVDQTKYDAVKKKQEERKAQYQEKSEERHAASRVGGQAENTRESSGNVRNMRNMKVAVFAVFALLCLLGVSSMNGGSGMESLQVAARQIAEKAMEQRLPDALDGAAPEETAQAANADALVAEDKLNNVILQENAMATASASETVLTPETENAPEGQAGEENAPAGENAQGQTGTPTEEGAVPAETQQPGEMTQTSEQRQQAGLMQQTGNTQATEGVMQGQATQTTGTASQEQTTQTGGSTTQTTETASQNGGSITQATGTASQEQTAQATGTASQEQTAQVTGTAAQPTSYKIKKGDTLIGISLRNYGTDAKVRDICTLNQIANPDDIKIGQTILLP